MAESMKYIVYTDGGSRGNPGPSASAYLIIDQHQSVLAEGGKYIGVGSNNQAEYNAVLLALTKLGEIAAGPVVAECRIDSLLVVNELNGTYKIRNRELWPVHEQILSLVERLGRVTFVHIPREMNTAADAHVNKILDDNIT